MQPPSKLWVSLVFGLFKVQIPAFENALAEEL